MATIIKNFDKRFAANVGYNSFDKAVKEEALSIGIKEDKSFKKISNLIGETQAFALYLMKSSSTMSAPALENTAKLMRAIANEEKINIQSLTKDEGNYTAIFNVKDRTYKDCSQNEPISITYDLQPEYKVDQSTFKNGLSGQFVFDLFIAMRVKNITGQSLLKTVVVEFDGDVHFKENNVINDKKRDSLVQGYGINVFRIQTPPKHRLTLEQCEMLGQTKTQISNDEFDKIFSDHIHNIARCFKTSLLTHQKALQSHSGQNKGITQFDK